MRGIAFLFLLLLVVPFQVEGRVTLGVDRFFSEGLYKGLKGKRVGLVTNHTGVNARLESTAHLLQRHAGSYTLVALFGPEHGLDGAALAEKRVADGENRDGIPIYSLYGATRRPTEQMLEGIDLLIYDIQDIGSRCYTYASTLYYVMEEAASRGIEVVVFDRPNPLGGVIVDGPMLEEQWRSFVGYVNVPYCHGMTIGELARYFNEEYRIGCSLRVVPMKGWRREMYAERAGVPWVPTSPHIPHPSTPYYYAATGMITEALRNVSNGVGYTLPFQLIGAPWIDADRLADSLNKQGFAGVRFQPFHFSPFFGRFKGELCHGVRLIVTDPAAFRPVSTQFLILGMIKSLYPKEFDAGMERSEGGQQMLAKVGGSAEIYRILTQERYVVWKLIALHRRRREAFEQRRRRYLLY